MRSVADTLRRESLAGASSLSPSARLALALRLGTEDAQLLSRIRGISLEEAERVITRTRAHGRIASIANRFDAP